MSLKKIFVVTPTLAIILFLTGSVSASSVWYLDRSGNVEELSEQVLGEQESARLRTREVRQEIVRTRLENTGEALRIHQVIQGEDGQVGEESEQTLPLRERLQIEQEDGQPLEINPLHDRLELIRNNIRTRTDHPLQIGTNNELIITRPDGTEKVVTILPDAAAENMKARFATVSGEVELDVEGDLPVYRFATRRVRRILGLFPSEFASETTVSTETGEELKTTSTESSPLRRLLELVSF